MGLANPGRALGRSHVLLIFLGFRLCLASRPFPQTHFGLAGLPPCFAHWTQSFLSDRHACVVYQNHKRHSFFDSVKVFYTDSFLALHFSLSSLMIFLLLCLLPSAALFMLMIWPFGPPPPRSPLKWGPHKELCFHWSAGLSTGVFLSIQTNVRPPSSQWIPTKLTSSPTPPPTRLLLPFQSHSNLYWGLL